MLLNHVLGFKRFAVGNVYQLRKICRLSATIVFDGFILSLKKKQNKTKQNLKLIENNSVNAVCSLTSVASWEHFHVPLCSA